MKNNAPKHLALLSAIPVALFALPARAADAPKAPAAATAPAGASPAAGAAPATAAPGPTTIIVMQAPPPESDDVRYPKKSMGVFINPISILFGFYGAEFDVALAKMVTLNIQGMYYSHSIDLLGVKESQSAVGAELGAQIFPLGRAFNQLYVWPRFDYLSYKATSSAPGVADVTASASLIGFGGTVGYQWTYTGGFSLRLGGGVIYYKASAQDANSTIEISIAGTVPQIDASIGWTF